jgi:hypothetical protein
VNMDKVPMSPGFGQQPRFVVTIQPVGTTFNPPAPMTIPNVDGLAPRGVTEMYSYDHDLATFVAIGSATVSDDGSLIRSDPGVGILKAGWNCGGNPNATGSAGTCPQCKKCNGSDCVADPAKNKTTCQKNKICKDGNCVCPVPTNWKETSATDIGNGTLEVNFTWESSTGDLTDLKDCTISERVTYPGPSPFIWPSPPWNGDGSVNPTILTVSATAGAAHDDHTTKGFLKPYPPDLPTTFTATQEYSYVCPCANNGQPVSLSGKMSIIRTVRKNLDGSGTFTYIINEGDGQARIPVLP